MVHIKIVFDTLNEFYDRRNIIKATYVKMTTGNKWHYKHYIYSKRYLTTDTCDLIWNYLNNIELNEGNEITKDMLKKEFSKYEDFNVR